MSINKLQKFKVQKTGDIFNVCREFYPSLEIVFQNNKQRKIITETFLNEALKEGRVVKLNAKKKKVSYENPQWLKDYLIERDQIIEDERNTN